MTKTLMIAAALATFAGAASASLYGGYQIDVDPATLSDAQRVLVDAVVYGGGSTAEIVGQIKSIVTGG